MYPRTCSCTSTQACTPTRSLTHSHTRAHAQAHMHTCIHAHAHAQAHKHAHLCARLHILIHAHTKTCTLEHMSTHVHAHATRAHIHAALKANLRSSSAHPKTAFAKPSRTLMAPSSMKMHGLGLVVAVASHVCCRWISMVAACMPVLASPSGLICVASSSWLALSKAWGCAFVFSCACLSLLPEMLVSGLCGSCSKACEAGVLK